jgi:ABC-type bacteriocin/lantibiotic exporter with double-glycine peptidase domain
MPPPYDDPDDTQSYSHERGAAMNFKMILALLTRQEKRSLVFILLLLLVLGCIELVGVGSLGPFIAVVSNPGMIHSNSYLDAVYAWLNLESDNSFIILFGILVIIVLALSNVCLALINYILYRYSARRSHALAMRLLEKYLRQPYIFYLNVNTSELSKTILGDVSGFINGVLFRFLSLISSAIIVLAIFILLIAVNPVLAIVISVVLGLAYILIFTAVRKFLARKGAERNAYNTLKYKYINETFGGIKDIKILGKERVFLNFFSEPSRRSAMSDAAVEIVGDLPKYVIETIAIGGIIGIMVLMIRLGARVDHFLPMLTVYAFGAYRLLPQLQKMFRSVSSIKYNYPVVENLYKYITGLPDGAPLTTDDSPRMAFNNAVKMENISFSYPATDRDIIRNQSITIARNTSIALVGATG